MIDFLKNVGISNDVLVEMIKNNDETAILIYLVILKILWKLLNI